MSIQPVSPTPLVVEIYNEDGTTQRDDDVMLVGLINTTAIEPLVMDRRGIVCELSEYTGGYPYKLSWSTR